MGLVGAPTPVQPAEPLRPQGRKAAAREARAEAANASLGIRRRADQALQRADDDTRPAERRLAQHGRLRDDDWNRTRPADALARRTDSKKSKIEGVRFLEVWEAVCETR